MPSQRYRDHLLLFGAAGDYLLGLLTITNPTLGVLPEPVRLNSTDRNILSRGETFFASGFDYRVPSKEDAEVRTAIVLPALDRQVLLTLQRAHVAFRLKLEIVLYKTPDIVERTFNLVEIGKVFDAGNQTLAIECAYRDILTYPRPRLRYTPADFPALFGRANDEAEA
jgi:hypothetical protein